PLPMPSFWLGYLFLDARVTHGHPVYFNGKISRLGSRFYFTEAMLVKCTIGFLCMMLLAALSRLAGRRRRLLRSVVLLLPIGFYFTLSTMTKYQLGIRHLLPILPL